MKVAANEALDDAEDADMDIFVREDSDEHVGEVGDGGLNFCSSGERMEEE